MPGLKDLHGYVAACIGFHYLQQISMLSYDNPQGLFATPCAMNIQMLRGIWTLMENGIGCGQSQLLHIVLNFYKWKHV